MFKNSLNQQNRNQYYYRTLINGISRSFTTASGFFRCMIALVCVTLALTGWEYFAPSYLHAFMHTINAILFCCSLPFIFLSIGYIRGSQQLYNDLWRVGLKNAADEAPYLIERTWDGKKEILQFRCKGIPLKDWLDNRELLSTALNRYIVSVKQGRRPQVIIVTCVDQDDVIGTCIPWDDQMTDYNDESKIYLGCSRAGDLSISLDSMAHLLIAGATGSGKTNLCNCILTQMQQRGALIYIYDGKGGLDYTQILLRNADLAENAYKLLLFLDKLVQELNRRFELFVSAGVRSLSDYAKITGEQLPRIVLLVDEASTVLDTNGKTTAAKEEIRKIISGLSLIAQKGRVVGIHSIYAMQNPARLELPSAVQANLDKICGKADTVLSKMVLNSEIADTIPKDSHGIFYLKDSADMTEFQAYYYQSFYTRNKTMDK